MTMVRMRMHRAPDGSCWADSEDLPGYTAVASDALGVMRLVSDAFEVGFIGDPDADVRWQWCGDPLMGVLAARFTSPYAKSACGDGGPCPCEKEETRG